LRAPIINCDSPFAPVQIAYGAWRRHPVIDAILMTPFSIRMCIACAVWAVIAYQSTAGAFCTITRPLIDDVHAAIAVYKVRDLPWFLQEKESLDVPDPETGYRPLMTALILKKPKHFEMLLKKGANPDLTDRAGNTALHIAAQINAPGAVLRLLEVGADPGARNEQKQTFQAYLFMTDATWLSSRARRERLAVVKWLRDKNIDLEDREAPTAPSRSQ
jgi:hypothetical protein